MTQHYKKLNLEPDDVIAQWKLNFRLGNIIKYTARANHKGQKSADLCKVVWYAVKEMTEDTALADEIIKLLTTPLIQPPTGAFAEAIQKQKEKNQTPG